MGCVSHASSLQARLQSVQQTENAQHEGGGGEGVSRGRDTAVGVVRVQRGFIVSVQGAEASLLLLRQVVKRRRDEACALPDLLHPLLVSSSAVSLVVSLSWKTRRLPSAAASLSVGEKRKEIQCIDFSTETRKSSCMQISSYQTVGIDLLGFHSFLRRDLLDVFLGFLQPMQGEKHTQGLDICRPFKTRRTH